MVEPSETASVSDVALDLFGGHGINLEDLPVGDAVFHDTAKPGVFQTTFGRDTFDDVDFARAVGFLFQSLGVETCFAALGVASLETNFSAEF